MTQEQIEQLLEAVEQRVAKTLEDVTKERDDLKKRLDDLEAKFGEEGEVAKALAEIREEGDQTLREIIVGTEETPGLVARIQGLEKAVVTRKSLPGQDEAVTKGLEDPLVEAMRKAITDGGKPVTLGKN